MNRYIPPDFETIKNANVGDSAAIQKILAHYNAYIHYFAKQNGKEYSTMDFPDKTIYPTQKMIETIRQEFILDHSEFLQDKKYKINLCIFNNSVKNKHTTYQK